MEKKDTSESPLLEGRNKILYLAPHLSTGGMPKYLLWLVTNDLESGKDVYVIEFNFYSDTFTVQRDSIKKKLGNKFIAVDSDFKTLLKEIVRVAPGIIHIQDEPEVFDRITKGQFEILYNKDRDYLIYETSHTSSYDPSFKTLTPDKFVFCSVESRRIYANHFPEVERCLMESPITNEERDKKGSIKKLGLNPDKKHIVQVGLFNKNKNQAYTFSLAKLLDNEEIDFHFVGNLADNFKYDWEDLINNKPSNCYVWGEREDVSSFLDASDLFILPSLEELNPMSIKEALSYGTPCLLSSIPHLVSSYRSNHLVDWLSGDRNIDAQVIKNLIFKSLKFGITTSFYNSMETMKETIDSVIAQKYKNWIWFVTDDGSLDGTKRELIRYCKKYSNMIYVNQGHKKEMFWQPQKFVTRDCDFVMTLDSDDCLLPNSLVVYNKILSSRPNIVSAGCDYTCFNELFDKENILNSSYVSFSGLYKDAISDKKPTEDDHWIKKSNHMWGHLRCFKNIEGLDFGVNYGNKYCGNDSLHVSTMQLHGEHLNIRRNLYSYRFKKDGLSNKVMSHETWEDGEKIKTQISSLASPSLIPCSTIFDSDYENYNSLLLGRFNYCAERCAVSLITNKIDNERLLKELYSDHDIFINKIPAHKGYICINTSIGLKDIADILDILKDRDFVEISIYYFNNKVKQVSEEMRKSISSLVSSRFELFSLSVYYRHLHYMIRK